MATEGKGGLPPPARSVPTLAIRARGETEGYRDVPEETAVALSYGGTTHAVMMATPADLEDFAIGFSLTEGIVRKASEIESIDIVPSDDGIDVQMWLNKPRTAALNARRRQLSGPTGCGLCGIDSLAEAVRAPKSVGDRLRIARSAIGDSLRSLAPAQALNNSTRAVHAAGFWTEANGLVWLREDVGRHNALDKLVGALARIREDTAGGVVLLTSRVSVEMVQKTAVLGAEILVAISVPTALAIRTAEAAGITLVAVARGQDFEIFTHPHRILA